MSDEEALEQYLLTQNVNYFNLLYDRYTNKVYSKCISMLKESELAEDATQEIFVKVLLSISKFSGKSKFSTWLYSVTYNYCIDIIRKGKKEIIVSLEDNTKLDLEDDGMLDAEIMETNVFRLKQVLGLMNVEDKGILMMKYQDDLSIKEICDVMEGSEFAFQMRAKRYKEIGQ